MSMERKIAGKKRKKLEKKWQRATHCATLIQGCQLRLFKSRFRLFLNDLDLEISYLDYGLYFRLFYDVG